VNELRRQSVPVLSVDVHQSQAKCSLENDGLRLGLNYVKGIHENQIDAILEERGERAFNDLRDFCQRTCLSRRIAENLIMCGGMDSWGIPRRQLVWELGTIHYRENELDLRFQPQAIPLPP